MIDERGGHAFPPTRPSMLEAVRGDDPDARTAALETLARSYWAPARAYSGWRWGIEADAAQDVVQAFFAHALERDLFARFDASRARFRTYFRLCLDSFIANERKAATREKRGGGASVVSLDDAAASGEPGLAAPDDGADARFHREWVRAVFGEAVERVRAACGDGHKRVRFDVFRRYDLEPPEGEHAPGYAELAQEFDIPVTQVTNFLAWSRREFRARVLEVLRERAPDEAEFRADALELLGIRLP